MSHFDKVGRPDDLPFVDMRKVEAEAMVARSQANEPQWREEEAAHRAAEASLDRQTSEQLLLRQKNANRPCMFLGVDLYRNEAGKWVARFGELYVEGDTPEQAFDNFDHTWLHGDNGPEEGLADAVDPKPLPVGGGTA